MKTFSALLVFAAIIGTFAAVDYCDKKLCPYGKHIACKHSGTFHRSCPKNARLVKFNKQLQDNIVAGFNTNRNFIAGGGDSNHSPACRMGTMQWNNELAKLAELNVKQCRMNHDSCHNTRAYSASGQNLAWMTFGGKPNVKDLVNKSIKMWYDEVKQSKMANIRSYPEHSTGGVIGHFTAMVADRNIRIGCAASTYNSGETNSQFLFACNFAFTNMIGEPIYTDCDSAAQKCATGKNRKYPNLCSNSEKYKL